MVAIRTSFAENVGNQRHHANRFFAYDDDFSIFPSTLRNEHCQCRGDEPRESMSRCLQAFG
jgi:hypothetical protein